MAAHHGNVDLLNHIISKNPSLINVTNDFGWTPLMCACNSEVKDAYRSVLALVDANADITIETTASCGDSDFGDTPIYSSPIWEALRRRNGRSFRFLFIKGAIPLPPKTTCLRGDEFNKMVLWKNDAISIVLKVFNRRKDCIFGKIPVSILNIIIMYLDPIN